MRHENSSSLNSHQRGYLGKDGKRELELGLVVPGAFVRGIRHIGYKSNVEALAELIDNSIQAYAERIDLVLGYSEGGSRTKPSQLAVIDNGHGMDPSMLRIAMMWGGTNRENNRNGLGRFGYGLPCATVSIGRSFTVYSKLRGERCYAVNLDLDLLNDGSYDVNGLGMVIPAAKPTALPRFVANAIKRCYPQGWDSGTVVVVDKLDRLDWVTASGLRRNLLRNFGVTYHKLLAASSIHVDGAQVLPIDPLFLNPMGEFHSLDHDRAQALDPLTQSIDCGDGVCGDLSFRYSWLPPTFGATDKSRDAIGLNANARFPILKAYHGLVFSRNGRVIDVQSRTPWTTFVNNDRYIRIEVEFSATLDEAFGVTTSKQQVSLSPSMWNHLQFAGLPKAIEQLRAKVRLAKTDRRRCVLAAEVANIKQINAPRNELTVVSSNISTKALKDDFIDRKKFAEFVGNKINAANSSVALSALLKSIDQRVLNGEPWVVAEYRSLLNDWLGEMSQPES